MNTNLVDMLRERAKRDHLLDDHALWTAADALADLEQDFFTELRTLPVGRFVAGYNAAKKVWYDYTGERIV